MQVAALRKQFGRSKNPDRDVDFHGGRSRSATPPPGRPDEEEDDIAVVPSSTESSASDMRTLRVKWAKSSASPSERDLRLMLEAYGAIDTCLIRPRLAFVCFADQAGMDNALQFGQGFAGYALSRVQAGVAATVDRDGTPPPPSAPPVAVPPPPPSVPIIPMAAASGAVSLGSKEEIMQARIRMLKEKKLAEQAAAASGSSVLPP
jgi:hypothetical protein